MKKPKNHLCVLEARSHKNRHLEAANGFSGVCLRIVHLGRDKLYVSILVMLMGAMHLVSEHLGPINMS